MNTTPSPSVSPRPPFPPRTPEALLARYRATGDPEALGALFDGTASVLFRMAVSLTSDASVAEDCVQETYLAALEGLERYDASRAVMPWLVGILENMVRRARRDRTRVPDPIRVAAAHPAEAGDAAAIDAEHDEEARQIRGVIDSLEEPYRSVALLRWRYGLSPAEIADVRGEPPGTVRSLLSRALDGMRKRLKAVPALALLPMVPLGLAAVREAVIARGVELGIGTAASAAGAAGLSIAWKASIAAATLALAGGGWLAWRSGSTGDDTTTASAGRSAPAGSPVPPPVPPDSRPVAPPEPPAAEREPVPSVAPPAPDAPPPPPAGPGAGSVMPPSPEPDVPTAPPLGPDPGRDPQLGVDSDPKGPPAPVPSDPATGSPEDEVPGPLSSRIDAAVERGVRWLRQRQLPDGSWGMIEGNEKYGGGAAGPGAAYGHPAGSTALALYALLKSGVATDDPVVKRGFSYLRDRQRIPGGSYELGMMLLAVTATADPFHKTRESEAAGERVKLSGEMLSWAQKLHAALLERRQKAKTLGWRYQLEGVAPPPGGNEDLSSTQLAALALLAAERCGIRTESRVWNELITYALKQQEADGPVWPRAVTDRPPPGAKAGASSGEPGRYAPPKGSTGAKDRARGFAYIRSETLSPDEGQPTGGMTACGLGVLQIARSVLVQREDKAFAQRDLRGLQQAFYDGLAWLDRNWSPYANPMKRRENVYHIYYLYCVERALDLVGNVLLGGHRWYAEMAEQLVARQSEKGFWDSDSTHKPGEVLDTSFALLFLRRATKGLGPVTDSSDSPPADNR